MAKEKEKVKLGSLTVGFALGSLIGWYLSGIIPFDIIYLSTPLRQISAFGIFFGLIFLYLGYKKPVFTEYLAYAISIYIILQYAWDYKIGNVNAQATYMMIYGLLMLVTNSISGRVKFIGAEKTAKKAIGL